MTTPLGRLAVQPGTHRLAVERALRGTGPAAPMTGVWARISRHAEDHPNRVAVRHATLDITYAGFARRVRQMAAALSAQGCTAGDLVAVLMARSADAIVAFVAVEALGAVHVPIDPAWPTARVDELLQRIQPRCVVSVGQDDHPVRQSGLRAPGTSGWTGMPAPGAPEMPLPPRSAVPGEARYIIHTSGSTGRPKGAIVTQEGMTNHIAAFISNFEIDERDVVAWSAPPGFVISVWQMLAGLLVGGTVAVIDDATLGFGRLLAAHLHREGVTVLEAVPTIIGWLVAARRELPALRCLVSTGEKLEPALAASVCSALPHTRLFNVYGASETSDDVTIHCVQPADTESPRIPIGRPIPEVTLYLLVDEGGRWRAAEHGEAGQLWVGGRSVGIGYFGEPALTQAAFFVDEFDPDSPTGRLYHTGDIARFIGGTVHCLGRADRQIKVAGVRVELDEVEATIGRLPAVARCAVVPYADNGVTRIAVHYVPATAEPVEAVAAQARLALPTAMVPRRWNCVEELPCNTNGKTNYRELAAIHTKGNL
nr:non-ribosomal peptide synthetase 21 [Streptomyces sp.]